MNTSTHSAASETNNLQTTARTAGILYFAIIASSLLSMAVGPYKLMVEGDLASTISNIQANVTLFRAGILYDLVMYTGVMFLAYSLYRLLKPVHKNLALFAFLWRIGEAVIGCLSVIGSLIIIRLISGKVSVVQPGTMELERLIDLLLQVNTTITTIVFVFLSIGTILFCYLFYKSKCIPRALAVFGWASFLLMLVCTLVNIIIPIDSLMFCGTPAILFELTIGVWLIINARKIKI